MEISEALRSGYFMALNGNVTHNNNPVPVMNAFEVPENIPYPYILLSSQTQNQREGKGCKIFNCTILIDIVTGSIDMSGTVQTERIANQVENIINPDSGIRLNISQFGYSIGKTIRGQGFDRQDKNGVYYVYRKLIRYNHTINKI